MKLALAPLSAEIANNNTSIEFDCRSNKLKCKMGPYAIDDILPKLEETGHLPSETILKRIRKPFYGPPSAFVNYLDKNSDYSVELTVISRSPKLPDESYPVIKISNSCPSNYW